VPLAVDSPRNASADARYASTHAVLPVGIDRPSDVSCGCASFVPSMMKRRSGRNFSWISRIARGQLK
jgi:hypothetical protein